MKTCTHYVLYIPHCMFFVCTCTLSFTLYMQLTLLIHVNSMTAVNTSHLLSPGAWHMIPVIGHQRRLIAVILSKLTCDFRNLPTEHNIYPNVLFQRMLLSCQTWLISWMFALFAVEKHCKTHILFFVNAAKEKYIETVLPYRMMSSYSSKIVQLGFVSCAMTVYFPLIT